MADWDIPIMEDDIKALEKENGELKSRILELETEAAWLQDKCDRLDSENRFIATYYPGNPEVMDAYRRGHEHALGMRKAAVVA